MTAPPDIFLSYNREDQAVARRFAEAFEREGFSVWWDATLRSGEAYDEVTENALRAAKAVVVLWSKKSVVSRWVRAEATLADRNKTLVPAMIEPCDRPIMFELTQTADLSHWQGTVADPEWIAFLADVRQFIGRSSGPARSAPAGDSAVPRPMAKSASRGEALSIAVLPFTNMSSDPEQEYFADGLSEELLNHLAQLKGLQVAGRTSSFYFKGKHEDLRIIGEKLGVNHLLEGSVRKAGNRLRITAQLIDAATGTHLWSQTYDRTLDDVFAIQEGIARAVAEALSITLGVGKTVRVAGGTSHVGAYEKYLRARGLYCQSGHADLLRAISIYREALALDPSFARAWSGLHTALATTLFLVPENSAATREEMAEASAHVLALAPDAWWAQDVCAVQFRLQRRWLEAEVAAREALASAPASEVDPIVTYAFFLFTVGRVEEAIEYAERARNADPLSLGVSRALQVYLTVAARFDEAQAEYDRSKELAGSRSVTEYLALLRLWRRKDAAPAAIETQYRAFLQHHDLPMALTRRMLDALENPTAALAVIQQGFDDPANRDPTRTIHIATCADHYGDKDLALAALQRNVPDPNWSNVGLIWFPFETGLRTDPRFKQILRDLKLVDYFRASANWGDFCRPSGPDDFECR